MRAVAAMDDAPTKPAPGFWRRRFLEPILAQLTQGVSADRIALTFGVGTACSLLPFLGFTTLLNLAAGIALRMNQPILQAVNTLLSPLQLALILVYVRVGERLWGAGSDPFTVGEMIRQFGELHLGAFLQRFGWAGIHALTAWTLTAPLVILGVTAATRPLVRRLAAGRR